jgi:hypothetical protein
MESASGDEDQQIEFPDSEGYPNEVEWPTNSAQTQRRNSLRGDRAFIGVNISPTGDEKGRLGRDVFVWGQPFEGSDLAVEAIPEINVIEFLWASMALFDDGATGPDVSEVYRPGWRELYSIPEARARILERLAETSDGLPLDQAPAGGFGDIGDFGRAHAENTGGLARRAGAPAQNKPERFRLYAIGKAE